MAVINVSSESFYKDSVVAPEASGMRAQELEQLGAEIIDVGGASSAPPEIYGTDHVSESQELNRIREAMKRIRSATDLPISIDTTSATVAEVALDLGADMVNDVSGLKHDPRMAQVVASKSIPVVIMARCHGPCQGIETTIEALRESLRIASEAGIGDDQIMIDPGVGFGRPASEDVRLIRELRRFNVMQYPVLVGVSRKAFIGSLLGHPDPKDRLIGSVAVTSIAVAHGADIIRTHDVIETREAIQVGVALREPSIEAGEIVLISDIQEDEVCTILQTIGVDSRIRRQLAEKGVMLNLFLHGVKTPGALIIKQEMLALGGDAAYHRDVIDFGTEHTDLLIMGTVSQIRRLAQKLSRMKYFGLQDISEGLYDILTQRNEIRCSEVP